MGEEILRFDINLFAIITLATMMIVAKVKRDVYSYSSTLFQIIIAITMMALVIEPITWIFDGKTFVGARFINYTSNLLLVIITPVLIGFWGSYLDYTIFREKKRLYRRHFYQLPTYLTIVLMLINAFHPLVFSVSINNVYIQEGFFLDPLCY